MRDLNRRPFVGSALAAFPLAAVAHTIRTSTPVAKAALVPHGEDRQGQHHSIGISSTDFKVTTEDSGGALFLFEHTNHKKGGPPRHLHHNEDEWFYAIEGDYLLEVGPERFHLRLGDSILAPREVPHAWAFLGDTSGKHSSPSHLPTRWKLSSAKTRSISMAATMPTKRRFTAPMVWSYLVPQSRWRESSRSAQATGTFRARRPSPA